MRFELIKGTASLEGTCYFEFCKGSNRKEACWNKDALYLEDGVFEFLYKSFSRASKEYDYYDFCKFERNELEKLGGALIEFEYALNSFQSREDYEAFFGKLAICIDLDEEHDPMWKGRVNSLKQIAKQLREIVDDCLESGEPLWVLGM